MIEAVILDNTGTDTTPRNGGLDGVAAVERPQFHAKKYKYYWRWYDEPNMEPQFLCDGIVNQTVTVPFDPDNRDMVIMQVAFDQYGHPNVTHPREGASYIFTQNVVAVLVSVTFSAGVATLTIANNNGSGNIHIHRQLGSGDFTEIASVSPSTTTYNDTLTLNGTYTYKLSQDGLPGFSNSKSVVAGAITGGGGTGSTPDGLSESDTEDSTEMYVDLSWTNHGATGDIQVWKKTGAGGTWNVIATLASSATSLTGIEVFKGYVGRTDSFRVSNTSATGFSNEVEIYVSKIGL